MLATTLGRERWEEQSVSQSLRWEENPENKFYWLTDGHSQYAAGKAQITPESVEAYWDTPEQRDVQPVRAAEERPVLQLRRSITDEPT